MIGLFLLTVLVFIAAVVFAVIALIRRICKKTYKTHWRISGICLGVSAVSLVIASSGGQLSMAVMLAALLLMVYGICQSVVMLVRKIRKRPARITGVKAAVSFGAGICAAIIAMGGNVSSVLNLFAVLFFLATLVMLVVNIIRAIIRRRSLAMWLSVPACLVVGVLLLVFANHSWNRQIEKNIASGEIREEPIQITYDFEVVDGDTPIEIIPSRTTGISAVSSVHVFEEEDLHLALENDHATAEMCIEAIRANGKIDDKFKTFFCDFVERIEENYPGLNLAILYHNLETLDVQELSANDYFFESLSLDSLGCYKRAKNTIFIPEGTQYIEGEFGFQVLLHEFCHAARTSQYEKDGVKCTLDFYADGDSLLLSEALNSAFSCSLLDYYEWNIAYQVPSNYLRIMLECMDNYGLEDYIKHCDTYFLSKLDEATGRTNYAQVIWKLITLQRSDWEQDNMDIPAEEYYPIYDLLCEMYYGKYITDDMTADEQRAIADELVHKAFYDAPENYKIDPGYFYEYLGLEMAE